MVRKTRATKEQNKPASEDKQPQPQPKVQVKEEKTQPIQKKPKKYQKSVNSIERIERSKHQKIFLLQAKREEQNWSFTVLGTTGSKYHVKISTIVSCTCFDFKVKKSPCKHIFFIVTQVAQNDQLLDYFRSTAAKISKAAYSVLDKQLKDRLESRLNASTGKDSKEIDLKDDTDCTICFTQMDKENQKLEDCSTCKKYFHVVCLDAWKNHNPTCPLCRSTLSNKGANDPLGKLKNIKID